MSGHATPDQVVHDQAIEHGAQEELGLQRQGRAQAENGVRRDASCRKDRRDERDAIRRAGDVPVGKPRTLVARRVQEPPGVWRGDAATRRLEIHAKRLDLLALDDRKAASCRPKVLSIVGRIELPAEPRRPAVFATEGRKQRCRTFDNREVQRRAEIGNGEAVA